jgi:hypothetical protein
MVLKRQKKGRRFGANALGAQTADNPLGSRRKSAIEKACPGSRE